MTRFIHDQFCKQYFREILANFGLVEAGREIAAEVQQIDLYFSPNSSSSTAKNQLGLLGSLLNEPILFEPFRNPITSSSVLSCLGKLITVQTLIERDSKKEKGTLKEREKPYLWILTPTASRRLLQNFIDLNSPAKNPQGIYHLAPGLRAGIIVIHQLEKTPETLWLRVLGRGQVQTKAIQELTALPKEHPFREKSLELVYNLLTVLELRQRQADKIETEEQKLIMQLSPIYLQRLEEATQEGIEQGIEQERRANIESLLLLKFGEIDPQLRTVIDSLIKLPSLEFTTLILQSSRDSLLQRFAKNDLN